MRLWSNIARHVRRNRAACCIVPSLIRQTSISSLSEFTAPACLAPRLHSLPSPCSDAPSFSFNLLMASPLLGSTYCSPACLRSRTQPQPSVSVSISGSILPKPVAAALFNKRPTPFSAVHNRSLAHPSISFSMSRRTRSPVIAQVSQTESKPNSKSEGQPPEDNFYIAASVAAAMATGVANRVLYKMALVPMGNYVFVLSQFQTFGYLLVYFGILATRYRSGQVTQKMLDAPDKRLFLGIGGLEAASQLLGFVGASKLPGVTLPLLSQSIILFQIALSYLVLKKNLEKEQIIGALVVAAGVCLAAAPSDAGANVFQQADPLYIGIFVSSMLFPALASIIKEKIFADAKEELDGQPLDIFVVNSFGSGAQAVGVLLLLPVLTSLRGLSLSELPQYVGDGLSCFQGMTPGGGSGCDGAPLLPILYVSMNLAYNISLLNLLRSAGAVVQSLTNSSITPLTIFAFTFSIPYLQDSPDLGAQFIAGSAVLVAGLATYNLPKWKPWLVEKFNK